jgi:hypothetical protein
MMEPAKEQSLICTNTERDVFRKVCEYIEMREPCAVVGIVDMGKKIMYREVVQHARQKYGDICVGHTITKDSDPTHILVQIENALSKSPLIFVVHVASGADIHKFVLRCQHIRDNQGTRFTIVLISDLEPIYPAYAIESKLVLRSLITHTPFTKDDSYSLVRSFESRFSHITQDTVKEKLFELSGGSAGVLKSLFLLTKDHNLLQMTDEEIMQETSIQYRLEALKNDIPEPIRKRMETNLPLEDADKKVLTLFGVLKEDGSLFSPLLEKYMNVKRDPLSFFAQSCTSAEMGIIELLRKNIGRSTSRDQIAQSLWGADWEDKYSDWAIDQAIHRLRSKLRDSSSPYSIHTKKGIGFILKKG